MSFRPLAEDTELDRLLDEFSSSSEICARAKLAHHRAATATHVPDPETYTKPFLVVVEEYELKRQRARVAIKALINTRLASAYTAGIEDGLTQQSFKRSE
jgi:hypothetical protein